LGYWQWDLFIIKSWKTKQRLTTQFRTEIYNVTNATKFFNPLANLNNPSAFGKLRPRRTSA
jgi:hypothetical protein